MFKIVIDGGGDMPRGWAEEFEFQVIPINIHFKGVTYRQGEDLTDEDFYRTCDASPEIPKTSQPTPQQFIDLYKKIANLGDTILSLHISSKLSGTFESAVLAARELVEQYHIIPFDTLSGSAALAYMAREVRLMDRAGKSLQQILQRLEFIRQSRGNFDLDQEFTYFVLNQEESLLLGGCNLSTRLGPGAREIGYWIHKDHINQGYATEVAAALTRVAFEIDHVNRVEIHCSPKNIRSAAVPKKLGFIHEATLHNRVEDSDGSMRDTMIWSLFRQDYPASLAANAAIQAFDALGRRIL